MSQKRCLPLFAVLIICTMSATDAAVSLQINPPRVNPGETPTLDVNCSFVPDASSKDVTIFTLIISKSTNGSEFVDLVSINALDSNHIAELTEITAHPTGHIENYQDPYLNLRWTDPTAEEIATYKCIAYGVDLQGNSIQYNSTAQAVAYGCDCVSEVLQLESSANELAFRLQEMMAVSPQAFNISEEYNGRRYYLSNQFWKNADVAQLSCRAEGGYVAEINDASEYQFIKDFLPVVSPVEIVLVGATDEYIESYWQFRNNRDYVTFFDWFPGEPDTMENDCMVLISYKNWTMNDFPCYNYDNLNRRYYLCEVPM